MTACTFFCRATGRIDTAAGDRNIGAIQAIELGGESEAIDRDEHRRQDRGEPVTLNDFQIPMCHEFEVPIHFASKGLEPDDALDRVRTDWGDR